jgi:F-type H+-transporting ATPase subunit epsilon
LANQFLLRLLTPYKNVFEGEVEAVIVPGEVGEFGVLANHTKYISTLVPGILRYIKDGQTSKFTIGGGFAEVCPSGVTVLADSMETPEEIDVERAKTSRDRSIKQLEDRSSLDESRIKSLELHLARAINRLKLAKN